MNAALGWAALAAALLLTESSTSSTAAANGSPPGSSPRPPARRPAQPTAPDRAVVVAVAAVVAACLAALGLRAGGVAAVVIAPLTATGLRRLPRRPRRDESDRGLALVLDLAATALRSGHSLAHALALAAPAGSRQQAAELRGVARLLRLGADPAQAWADRTGEAPLAELTGVAIRSATSGSKLAEAFERLAGEMRATAAATAAIRAQRAGLSALGPLAACFLPSFVCLGVVPVVVGMARAAFGEVS